MENVWDHFGNWGAVVVWIALYGVFIAFIPFYKKSQRKPSSLYLAFIVAFALEMFGVPFSMYIITWLLGAALPEGILWGHTLSGVIGDAGVIGAIVLGVIGAGLVYFGWSDIHKHYWSKEDGEGRLVTSGIYAYIRHPQYTGFLLMTLGCLIEWATLPLLIMWPALAILYYRLARREETDMEREFGDAYREYKARTSMFIPLPKLGRGAQKQVSSSRA